MFIECNPLPYTSINVSNTALQSELSKARASAKQSEAALREKNVDVEKLSTLKQQEGGSLRTALQAKEIELTKAMDKLLQVC